MWLATQHNYNRSHVINSETLCAHVEQLNVLPRMKENVALGLPSVKLGFRLDLPKTHEGLHTSFKKIIEHNSFF